MTAEQALRQLPTQIREIIEPLYRERQQDRALLVNALRDLGFSATDLAGMTTAAIHKIARSHRIEIVESDDITDNENVIPDPPLVITRPIENTRAATRREPMPEDDDDDFIPDPPPVITRPQ